MTGSNEPILGEDDLRDAARASLPDLADEQIDRLLGYRDLLFETNQRVNLTAVRDRGAMGHRLLLESIRLVGPLRDAIGLDRDPRVMDLGTGGGVPGVFLAIACPELPFTLMDATGKKLAAIAAMTQQLGLSNVQILHGRAEELGHDPAWRGQFTAVTARAVSSLPALMELGLPFLKRHGRLLLPKGIDIDDELESGRRAARTLGGEVAMAAVLPDNGSHIETTLVTVEKIRETPAAYPRRSGLPSRSPLGVTP